MESKKGRGALTSRYLAAIILPAVTAVGVQVSWPLFYDNSVSLYMPAVIFCAWYGGLGPGLLSVGISFFLADFFFIEPYFSLGVPNQANFVRLVLFAVIGPLICVISELLYRERRLAEINFESINRAENIVESSDDAILSKTLDGVITSWNKGAEKLYGYTAKEMIGRHIKVLAPPERLDEIPEILDKLKRGEHVEHYETQRLCKDGRRLHISLTISVIRNQTGQVIGASTIARDITDRKRAEALLYAKEQEFRAIVENAPDQIIRYDRNFVRTYVNPAVIKTYGLPAQAFTGKPVGSVIQDAGLNVEVGELAHLRNLIAAVFETGELSEYEMTWPTPTGRRSYNVRFFPELDFGGAVINVLAISRDITERKNIEEALKNEKEILKKVFDNIPVMIGFVGNDGRVKLVNPEWERVMGWTLKEIQEQDVDIFDEAYPDLPYRQQVLDFVAASTGEWVDLKIRTRDKSVVDVTCAVVHLSGGTKVAIAKDITERKNTEQRLREYERALEGLDEMIIVVDRDYRYQLANRAYLTYRNMKREELVGRLLAENLREGLFENFIKAKLDECFAGNSVKYELKYNYPALGERDLLISYFPIEGPTGIERAVCVLKDTTESKRADEQIKATSEQLRALSARLESAREEEGARIARELHDEMGGALTSLKWDLESLDASFSELNELTQLQDLRKKIQTMLRLSEATISIVRRISSELRPSVLDDLGLAEAIQWQARQFQARTGTLCHFDCSVENLNLDQEQSTALFRILQEALTNILRHAQAKRVDIAIKQESGGIVFTVSDNGRGITEDEKSRLQSLGILGMRERAYLIGGEIDIKGVGGLGTVVTVRVPNAEGKSDPMLRLNDQQA